MTLLRIMLMAFALGGLSACGSVSTFNDAAREYTAPTFAETYALRCKNLSMDDRMKDWAAFQGYLDEFHTGVVALAFDCDADGSPDFTAADVEAAGYYTPPQ